ncbi:ImmA/IrrE family metallo-endopeptidase [Prauserella cavernicola]|uniref:ImmA/IrrE family metallo-endopeptidase n=1 Tax=Prauserella cavernicola TaxID=2800127 RepID=A0A934QRH4_9PSEU|nr:ImmA/IrrE family metallo-endopeptidase [Prauserella cavernicola]MBK1784339.1 ImmA/IrrE family metallo-endopeptidase [Prauserella cavernicola]
MALRRGFKAEAKRLALEVRAELGVHVFAPLDPYALAELYGIEVHDLSDPSLPRDAVRHFTGPAADAFSAALVSVGRGCVIIENHVHEPNRRRSTIAHEMAHVLLEHDFGVLLTDGEQCRSSSSDLELEAAELSGELLVPCDAARTAAFRGWTDSSVARYFRVSRSMARWRLNATAARRIARCTKAKGRGTLAADAARAG